MTQLANRWLLAAAFMLAAAGASAQSASAATTYRNPVIPGFHADPSICRSGADYYLATSSFEYFPGVPIFHSRDLVHWEKIGHALTRASQAPLAGLPSSKGIFAPTLRCGGADGEFYMITTNVEGGGHFYVHARDPAGPWSEPVWLNETEFGMDPSLLFDDDGKVYFTRHGGGEHGGIYQAELDLASGKLKGEARMIWRGTGGVWPEGPHLYKINGWYYLMISEGGTSYQHMLTMARSKSPWGPFEAAPSNPILTHRDHPELPLQATGHGDLVQTPDGHWFMVLLGIRPIDKLHHLGRETLLTPLEWQADGWPRINDGKPLSETMQASGLPPSHPYPAPAARDQFDKTTLGLEWTLLRGPGDGLWSLSERPGFLRLKGSQVGLDRIGTPAFIGRRQQSMTMRAAARLAFAPASAAESAGLVLRMNEDNHYQLLIAGAPQGRAPGHAAQRVIRLVARVAGKTSVIRETAIGAGPVELQVVAEPSRYVFGYRVGGKTVNAFGSAPTAPLSSEKAGGFTGVFVGVLATTTDTTPMAPADVDWFDYSAGSQ